MTIIALSRGSFSYGREVALQVAEKLNYQCIGRELILEAAKEFNIPEIRLERSIHDAPSILDRFTYGRERYIAYFESAFLRYMRRDNVVYHGLAGQFFLRQVAHSLKIRIIADMEDRIRLETEQNKVSAQSAHARLIRDDQERQKWSKALYGIDSNDAGLYDMVLHISKIGIPEAVKIICDASRLQAFQTTYESQKLIDDLAVAAEVKAALIDLKPDIQVSAENGKVEISFSQMRGQNSDLMDEIKNIAEKIAGGGKVAIKGGHWTDWEE